MMRGSLPRYSSSHSCECSSQIHPGLGRLTIVHHSTIGNIYAKRLHPPQRRIQVPQELGSTDLWDFGICHRSFLVVRKINSTPADIYRRRENAVFLYRLLCTGRHDQNAQNAPSWRTTTSTPSAPSNLRMADHSLRLAAMWQDSSAGRWPTQCWARLKKRFAPKSRNDLTAIWQVGLAPSPGGRAKATLPLVSGNRSPPQKFFVHEIAKFFSSSTEDDNDLGNEHRA